MLALGKTGFEEDDPESAALEQQMKDQAGRKRMGFIKKNHFKRKIFVSFTAILSPLQV